MDFKIGDRVVVKIAEDEWYMGTVTFAKRSIKVDFDDHHRATIDPSNLKFVQPLYPASKYQKTKYEKPLTDKQANQISVTYKPKTVVETPPKQEEVVEPKAPAEVKLIGTEDEIAFYKALNVGATFDKNDLNSCRVYAKIVLRKILRKYYSKAVEIPVTVSEKRMAVLGMFIRKGSNVSIWLNQRTFNAGPVKVVAVMAHEACHYLEHFTKGSINPKDKGHGPIWQSAMIQMGLKPSAMEMNDLGEYLTDEQKGRNEKHTAQTRSARNSAMQNKLTLVGALPNNMQSCGLYVTWFHPQTSEWLTGITVGSFKKNKGRITVMENQDGTGIWNVPGDMLYYIPTKQANAIGSDEWEEMAKRAYRTMV